MSMPTRLWSSRNARAMVLAAIGTSFTLHAAVIQKAGTGTDLAQGSSWSSGSTPASGDAATWSSPTALGGSLSIGSPVTWGTINISAASGDIALTGSDLTTGSISVRGVNFNISNTVALRVSATYNIGAGSSATFAGSLTDNPATPSTARTLSKSGIGTLVLSGTNSYTGSTSVSGGRLNLDYSTHDTSKLCDSAGLTLGNASIHLAGGSHTEIVKSFTLSAGSVASITRDSGNATLSLGSITRSAGALFDLSGSIASTTTGSASSILKASNGTAYATVGGSDWAAKDAANSMIVGLSTVPGGYSSFAAGASSLSGNVDLSGAAGSILLAGNSTTTSLRSVTTDDIVIDLGAYNLKTGGLLASRNLTITSTTGSLLSMQSGGELMFIQRAGKTTVSARVADNGNNPSNLIKAGDGELELTNANNHLGGSITVHAGVIRNSGGTTANGSITVNNGPTSAPAMFIQQGTLIASDLTVNASNPGATVETGGTFIQTAGTTVIYGSLIVDTRGSAPAIGNDAAFTLSGGAFSASAVHLNGTTTVAGTGALNATSSFRLGADADAQAVLNQTGGSITLTTLSSSDLHIGANSNSFATLHLSGGSFNAPYTTVNLSSAANNTAQLQISGGVFNARGINLASTATSNAEISLVGGSLNIGPSGLVSSAGGSTTITLGAGSVGALDSGWSSALPMSLVDPTQGTTIAANDATDSETARDIVLSGSISGSGKLVKTGLGTLSLSGSNTYAGGTTIVSGALSANSIDALGIGTVTINGGRLTTTLGNVTTEALTMLSGSLDLNSDSSGTLTLAPDADFILSGGTWNIRLAQGIDRILGSGDGVISLRSGILDLGGGAIDYTGSYRLFDGFNSGTVSGLQIMGFDSTQYAAALGNNGLLTFSPIPEPHAIGLFILGTVTVALRRRR